MPRHTNTYESASDDQSQLGQSDAGTQKAETDHLETNNSRSYAAAATQKNIGRENSRKCSAVSQSTKIRDNKLETNKTAKLQTSNANGATATKATADADDALAHGLDATQKKTGTEKSRKSSAVRHSHNKNDNLEKINKDGSKKTASSRHNHLETEKNDKLLASKANGAIATKTTADSDKSQTDNSESVTGSKKKSRGEKWYLGKDDDGNTEKKEYKSQSHQRKEASRSKDPVQSQQPAGDVGQPQKAEESKYLHTKTTQAVGSDKVRKSSSLFIFCIPSFCLARSVWSLMAKLS